jgi:hypothetical protein
MCYNVCINHTSDEENHMASKSHRVANRPHFTQTENGALKVPGKVRMEDSVKRSKANDKVIVTARASMNTVRLAKLRAADGATKRLGLMLENFDRPAF